MLFNNKKILTVLKGQYFFLKSLSKSSYNVKIINSLKGANLC